MKIQFHGHACFSIITEDYWGNFHEIGKHLLIDPFITDNPAAKISADELNPDVILITHGHHDHIGDTVSIAKRTGCLVICNPEIESYLHKKGVTNTHGMNTLIFLVNYIKMKYGKKQNVFFSRPKIGKKVLGAGIFVVTRR